ncbi:DcaP family trimeric outer membrane transporter [Pseudomonas saliphila]|uniref:DcaP family trimeric outer membrane transporter n=1 Tax=Pseudomonas saliphila TaxID=2586906 RepID=UPI0019D65970|nr:DcaP family trimeric outer membrane transporter [Pseudomonas saliphila]
MKTTKALFATKPLAKAIACLSVPVMLLGAAPAFAQNSEIEELRRQLKALEARIEQSTARAEADAAQAREEAAQARAEAREARAQLASTRDEPRPETAKADTDYIVRDGKGIKIGNTTVTVGGFIKADAVLGSGGDGSANNRTLGQATNFANFADPTLGNPDEWRFGSSIRESRIGLRTSTADVNGHDLITYLEMDFHGSEDGANEFVSNSYNPRIRLAYAQWADWTVGQDVTTFSELSALPEILNQGKMAAFIYARQPLLRYGMDVPGGRLFAAIENPEDGGFDQAYPDVVLRYQVKNDYGVFALAGMGRTLEDDNERSLEGAVSLSARIPTIGNDNLRLQYSYGALGRYAGLRTFGDVVAAQDELVPMVSHGTTVSYQRHWAPKWRSNLSLSHLEVETNVDRVGLGTTATANRYFDTSSSAHLNLLYQATNTITLGLEYAYWDFGIVDDSGSNQYEQVMASAKFDY